MLPFSFHIQQKHDENLFSNLKFDFEKSCVPGDSRTENPGMFSLNQERIKKYAIQLPVSNFLRLVSRL